MTYFHVAVNQDFKLRPLNMINNSTGRVAEQYLVIPQYILVSVTRYASNSTELITLSQKYTI